MRSPTPHGPPLLYPRDNPSGSRGTVRWAMAGVPGAGASVSGGGVIALRNACVLVFLSSCILFSVFNFTAHLLGRDDGGDMSAHPFASSASFSGGVFSDPSDQLLSLEESIGHTTAPPNTDSSLSQTLLPTNSSSLSSSSHLSSSFLPSQANALFRQRSIPASPLAAFPGALPISQKSTDQTRGGGSTNEKGKSSSTGSGKGKRGGGGGAKDTPALSMRETAICLAGGARSFEATGPSILKHLIRAYNPADLFLHAPLDQDTAKLFVMRRAASVVAVRVFPSVDLDELSYPSGVLQAEGSPNGVQGLLQYFRLVEGCLQLIARHEGRRGGKQYKWVVRGRMDAYWSGPPPPLKSFNRRYYVVPHGNDFSGYNDRLGIGNRATTNAAMRRLSLLSFIKRRNKYTSLNSEHALFAQLKLSKVRVRRAHFPFCVLAHRLPKDIYGQCNPAVPSLASTIPLDGTKCMPCSICSQRQNKTIMQALYLYMDLRKVRGRYPDAKGIKVCNLSEVWKHGVWQQRFDAAAGADLARDRVLVSRAAASFDDCMVQWAKFKEKVSSWEVPSASAVCLRAALGPASLIGEANDSYLTFTQILSSSSAVVALDVGQSQKEREGMRNSSWEASISRSMGVKVQRWSTGELNRTQESMAALGVTQLHVLKLPTEVDDCSALDMLLPQLPSLPICQLLVSFPKQTAQGTGPSGSIPIKGGGMKPLYVYAGQLRAVGMQLSGCTGGQGTLPERCLFFSLKHCQA